MDVVVLKKDIARLVWDYLKTEELEEASHVFCKTSPFLEQEYTAFKKCLLTHSFFPKLEEIICEFVNISIKVEQLWPKFTAIVDFDPQKYKLSDKVIAILEDCELTLSTRVGNEPSTSKHLMPKCLRLSSGKESIKGKTNANSSRKRRLGASLNENLINRKSYKRRRISEPYCFLIPRSAQRHRNEINGGHDGESSSTSSIEDLKELTSEEVSDNDQKGENLNLVKEKPENESTPHGKITKKATISTPILPDISEVILHNSEFQQKLADNINQVLNTSVNNNSESMRTTEGNEPAKSDSPNNNVNYETDSEILPSQVLDNMVKDILEATENDPSYDTIVEECIEAWTARPQTQTIAVQCNMPGTQSLYASSEPPPLVPTQSFAHLSYPHCSDVLNISTHNAPPRTPLIIRTAVTTATSNATPSSAQENNQLISNNSFGSLIDPNFSVSKLIVLNSNESVQKHQQQSQQPHLGIASNDNQILSQVTCLPPSVNSLTESTDDQLYFDSATGQLTFPVYLANDAVITNFLINNEIVGQQLQTNSSLAEDSVALPEPAADMHLNPIDDQNNEMTNTKKDKAIVKSSEPPSSANSYLLGNKTTPACGIINPKACKSLSTPRKRASHVRTLTFSPRGPQLGLGTLMTPLSTRREHLNRFQRTFNISNRQDVSVEQVKEEDKILSNSKADTAMVVPEKPIIKNVEILPTISATSNHVINENSSSSCNVPPLFIHEESSNQTVINGEEPKLVLKSTSTKSETNATVDNTPKRQQSRKNAVRACKRQIPSTSRVVVKKGKNNTNSCEANNKLESEEATTKNFEIEAVEEWRRLRNVRINNFDMHIREENAKMSQFKPGRKISTKRRIRRRKSAALKRKEKEIAAMAEESMEFDQVGSMDGKIGEYAENKQGEDERNVNLNESHFKISNHSLDGSTEILDKNEHKSQIKDKHSKFNIKIPTPQKAKESEKCKEEAKAKLEMTEAQVEADSERYEDNTVEYEKSAANIGVLLETPPKVHSPSYIPPTPGIFAPSLNTPSAKLNDVNNAMSASASFLFGSITKSELDTPLLSAVTPGSRFTFGLKEGTTPPRSNSNTECSSGGGSYYKPDESENLDQNIDQLLKNSGQKKPPSLSRPDEEESIKVVKETEKSQPVDNVQEGIEVEISVEKLRVEADVLKRVKPLGSEQVEIEDIDPHYTLASGLPEISAAEEEDSSSSSSSSSTSSSSSSSSSANSSRNSSSSSSSSNCSSPSKTTEDKEKASSNLILADLDNLSSISSTEGDEWQELQLSDNDENSQLISNDGEVRYPLRSWLTPIKENLTTTNKVDRFECGTSSREIEKQTTIKVTLPLKSTDKKHKESKELEMKRERLKEKLKTDASIQKKDRASSGSSAAPNILAARSATRIMHAMRDKGKKSTASPVRTPTPNNAYETREDSKRSMEVLTALNLSAKKQAPKTVVLRSATSNESKNRNLRLRHAMTNSNHPPQRRCLPIEARPVTRNICKTPGKKFVRTPLSFKSGHQTLALTSQKLLNEKKQSIDAPALRVSPRLRKTIQRTGKKTIVESPPIKSKINVKVSKPKVAVAKVKKTLKYNKKKLPTPKGRKKHLSEDSEDDEEEEDKPLKCMKVPVKPKIHVKAKNYMISKKIKRESDKSDNKIQAKKQTQNNEESKTKIKTGTIVEINDNNIHVTSDINKKCSNGKETATNDHVDQAKSACGDGNTETALEVIDDDDDILEDCELVSIDETDTKRFICIKYEGPDEPPPPAIKYDLSNVMHVDIDQNETHTWSVTETILLYSCEPNSSCDETQKLKRNKAKKLKKVRINDDRRKEDEKQEVSRKSRSPIATSTPVLTRKSSSKISTSQNDNCKQQLEGSETSDAQAKGGCAKECNKSVSPKMQTMDIETILSHIHGS